MKSADGAVAGGGSGAGMAAGSIVVAFAGMRAGEALGGVARALIGSLEPAFCRPSTEMSVLRNPLALNASTAASTRSWVGTVPNTTVFLPDMFVSSDLDCGRLLGTWPNEVLISVHDSDRSDDSAERRLALCETLARGPLIPTAFPGDDERDCLGPATSVLESAPGL